MHVAGSGPGPPPMARGHPSRLPLRRYACSGQKRYAAAHSAPLVLASARGPGSAAAPGPPFLGAPPGGPRPGPRPGCLAPPIGAGRRPLLRRRPWPPAASLRAPLRLRPARSRGPRPGRSGRPCWLRAARWPPSASLRAPAVPLGGPPLRVPPGPPGPPPALPRPSVGWWPGPALGSAAPRPGLVRGSAALFSAPGPGGIGVWGFRCCGSGRGSHGPVDSEIENSYDIRKSDSPLSARLLSRY